jgi:hypothetical protein
MRNESGQLQHFDEPLEEAYFSDIALVKGHVILGGPYSAVKLEYPGLTPVINASVYTFQVIGSRLYMAQKDKILWYSPTENSVGTVLLNS